MNMDRLEQAQRILENRCVECGEKSPIHLIECSRSFENLYDASGYLEYKLPLSKEDLEGFSKIIRDGT